MSEQTTSIFTLDGTDYAVDPEALTTGEAIVLKKFLGATPAQWLEMFSDNDPEAVQFYVWLGLTRAGETPGKPSEIDVPMFKLNIRPLLDTDEDADEADPTTSPEGETTD